MNVFHYPPENHQLAPPVRYLLAVAVLVICTWGTIASARAGLSRLLSEYSLAANSLEAAQRSVDFNVADPAAHYAYAAGLANAAKNAEAIAELERAVSLRPDDYFLWQELGRLREDIADPSGAVGALQRAIKLAPHYSEPHWQLGNVLLRRGEFNNAFAEMRAALAREPTLLPVMADLAWGVCEADVKCVLTATQPKNDTERLLLGRFLITRATIDVGVDLILAVSKIEPEERKQIVRVLIDAREFRAAHRVWLTGLGSFAQSDDLFDGGFEGPLSFDDQGFGWQPSQLQTVKVLLDPNNPQTGKRSLLLEYAGSSDATTPVISQLILVAPNARYRLSFAARTERLVSGGLPLVVIKDASGDRQVIAQSALLLKGTQGWREYSIDFETADTTMAINVNIQRQPCSSNPCPIMGRAGFDNFSIKRFQPKTSGNSDTRVHLVLRRA